MPKKSNAAQKAALKAQKRKKTESKAAKTARKAALKKGELVETEEDLLQTLERLRLENEAAVAITVTKEEGPPSRRSNATFTPCPVSTDLWLFGGECVDEKGLCHFYNDLFRYSPEKNEWKRVTSPNSPSPRSAHQIVPVSSGSLWLFGGEFASLNQTAFHHYRDLWRFDIATLAWERFDTRIRPSARSGHRMAVWKNFLVLFGGFHDTGIRTNYLSDLWLFDLNEYRWHEVVTKDYDRRPRARSGFSFLTTNDGIVLHGGYCKEYSTKGKRAKGIPLDDTWLLKLDQVKSGAAFSSSDVKWEKRKKIGYAPSVRSGTTMALWSAKSMGVLFGGVFDDDNGEETLESVFYNDMFGYQLNGTGRWVSLNLKKGKGAGSKRRRRLKEADAEVQARKERQQEEADSLAARQSDDEIFDDGHLHDTDDETHHDNAPSDGIDLAQAPDGEPNRNTDRTIPCTRYNTMIAVQRNTLYLYGGILETRSLEAILDDFYKIDLSKMDQWHCMKESEIVWQGEADDGDEPSDGDSNSDSSSSSSEDEFVPAELADKTSTTVTEAAVKDLEKKVAAFLARSKVVDESRSAEEDLSTPKPGENLKLFYERSKQYWAQKAHEKTFNRGKALRKDGFELAEEKFEVYRPILQEIERIQASAGLDQEEMDRAQSFLQSGESRHRR